MDNQRFKLYAAPRAGDGRYHFDRHNLTYVEQFESLELMLEYWEKIVIPNSSNTFGLAYELSMVIYAGTAWDFFGDPRYSNDPILEKAL